MTATGAIRLATNLLWLGLWPGLSGVYRRCSRFYMGERDELVNAISDHFEGLVRDADQGSVTTPAASLVKSCERLVREERFGDWERQATRANEVDAHMIVRLHGVRNASEEPYGIEMPLQFLELDTPFAEDVSHDDVEHDRRQQHQPNP